jgi:hypothetical protein
MFKKSVIAATIITNNSNNGNSGISLKTNIDCCSDNDINGNNGDVESTDYDTNKF